MLFTEYLTALMLQPVQMDLIRLLWRITKLIVASQRSGCWSVAFWVMIVVLL